MLSERLRRNLDRLRRTPLHPQWLIGDRSLVKRKLRTLAPGIILDIGCASRWLESELSEGCTYVGLDSYATGALLYQTKPNVFADACALPFHDGSFDVVIMLEVLEHVRDPRTAVMEAARVLRSGGLLLLSMPFLYPVHDAPHDYQRYTAHGLTREFDDAGLQMQEVVPTLGSAQTAGLLVCLALGGTALEAVRRRSPFVLLLPVVLILVPVINLIAWLAGRLLPEWQPMSAGYLAVACKP